MMIPAPLVLDRLREHFRRTYMLNERQVETMLVSSSKSLREALAAARQILKGIEPESNYVLIFHSLKGLLLNMGESEWAAHLREIENQLRAGEQLDHESIIGTIERGLTEILSYTTEAAPCGK